MLEGENTENDESDWFLLDNRFFATFYDGIDYPVLENAGELVGKLRLGNLGRLGFFCDSNI